MGRASNQRETSDAIAALSREIAERRAILFVGAGLSAGLGLPSWPQLIAELGEDLGYSADEFLELSNDFRSLTEYYRLEKKSIDALRDRMLELGNVDDNALRESRAHRLIVGLQFPIIYTTNYDQLLERAFALYDRQFNKTVTAKDIAREDPSLPTIVKFHGDLDDASSLVVTETDYFRRLAFEEPLDIKLTADAFARTMLFVGYSLSDVNLRVMLHRMRGIWLESGYESVQPRSYIFMARANAVQERILDSWGITPIVGEDGDETRALVTFLERLAAAVEVARSAALSASDAAPTLRSSSREQCAKEQRPLPQTDTQDG